MSQHTTISRTTDVSAGSHSQLAGVVGLIYGVVCYALFFLAFLYAIGFVGDLLVPKTIDSGSAGPLGTSLLIDALLLGVFAVQHSGMARPGFKKWWTRAVPTPIERSTYVLLSSLSLILIFWLWQPISEVVWSVDNGAVRLVLQGLFWLGWLLVLLGTFMINHFDLFGLRQVYLNARNQQHANPEFKTSYLYRFIRHPLMLGFLIAFWATPDMTVGHLFFSLATTSYILIAIQFEEHDLANHFGDTYRRYRERTPMLIPRPRPK